MGLQSAAWDLATCRPVVHDLVAPGPFEVRSLHSHGYSTRFQRVSDEVGPHEEVTAELGKKTTSLNASF